MSLRPAGLRVGAISHADDYTVYLFGYGIYQGDIIPPPEDNVRFLGFPMDRASPCILLDNGKRVYGCECWWASEQRIDAEIRGRTVKIIDIDEARKKNAS